MGLASTSLLFASPAQAEACNPVQRQFAIYEASVPFPLGTITLNTNICMNGSVMSSSTANMTWSASPAGMAAGWRFDNNTTQRLTTGPDNAGWVSSATMRLCVPTQISQLCSNGESFKINNFAYRAGFIGPQRGPEFYCTNSYCQLSL